MITTFQSITVHGTKSGKCICGKRITRSKTFEQTINPFNKNAKGEVKTYAEILTELQQERSVWMGKPPEHNHDGYWSWDKQQQKEYDELGRTKVKMTCGFEIEVVKP